jgi:L-ribulokinase
MARKLVLGIDYGTDSVRAVLIDPLEGTVLGSVVFEYPRWKKGLYSDAATHRFRQHPLDYLEGLEYTVRGVLQQAGDVRPEEVAGMTLDTTGSTPVAVDRKGIPLALREEFTDDPDAMFILWKDHSAMAEAEEINAVAHSWGGTDFTKYSGGIYSPEWFWAKVLHTLRTNGRVRAAAFSWVEHCDWMPALLTGNTDPLTLKRSRCAAGHKAMWHAEFGGLPSEEFLVQLDPLLEGLRERLYSVTYTADVAAGHLSEEWAARLGLTTATVVGVGAFDAHLGAVGGEIRPGYLSKVVGTSTCDMVVAPLEKYGNKLVKGISGQVDGSILPGMLGLEAGQSSFGDVYAWFRDLLLWPAAQRFPGEGSTRILEKEVLTLLTEEAEKITPSVTAPVALDWFNGRRTPDANPLVQGAVTGLALGTTAPALFRALVEATAFGSRSIAERFAEEGIFFEGVIALGGIAKKSPFVMQVLADVMNRPIRVARAEQAVALGAAMAASVAAGIHPGFEEAQQAMGQGFEQEYRPDPESVAVYNKLYTKYLKLGRLIEGELT